MGRAVLHRALVPLDAALRARVVAFVRRVGTVKAAARLGVSFTTLDSAQDYGMFEPRTVARLVAALEREELREAS